MPLPCHCLDPKSSNLLQRPSTRIVFPVFSITDLFFGFAGSYHMDAWLLVGLDPNFLWQARSNFFFFFSYSVFNDPNFCLLCLKKTIQLFVLNPERSLKFKYPSTFLKTWFNGWKVRGGKRCKIVVLIHSCVSRLQQSPNLLAFGSLVMWCCLCLGLKYLTHMYSIWKGNPNSCYCFQQPNFCQFLL